MIVVSNTSPITNLAAIGQLDLLRQMYQQVIIPRAVFEELTAEGGHHPGAVIQQLDWVQTRTVSNRAVVIALQMEVDVGEAEAMALAQKLAADLLPIDEHLGRLVAARLGINIIGLVGVLMDAKNRSLIRNIKPFVDGLRDRGFRVSDDLYMAACCKPLVNNSGSLIVRS